MVGLLNTGTTLAIIWGLMTAGMGPYLANLAGYVAGMAISFTLNRSWTFRQGGKDGAVHLVRFLAASGIAYLGNLAAVAALIALRVDPYLAQLFGMPVYTGTFFLLSKYYVFRASPVS